MCLEFYPITGTLPEMLPSFRKQPEIQVKAFIRENLPGKGCIIKSTGVILTKNKLTSSNFKKENKMAEDKKKKSIFDKAIDALTDRDEKEAAAKAAAEKAAADKAAKERFEREKAERTAAAQKAHDSAIKAAAEKEAAAKASSEKLAAEKAAAQKAAADKARLDAAALMEQRRKAAEMAEQRAAAEKARLDAEAAAKAAVKYIAEHTVAPNETLSHLALKYYGNAAKPYYMAIYEANKDVIGDNPNFVRAGVTLKIPEKPEV